MARSIEEIQNYIIAAKDAEPELAEASSVSRRAKWRLWTYVVAQAENLLEQIIDTLIGDLETQVQQTPAGTAAWIQAKVFDFQYDATTAQTIELNTTTLAYQYAIVNTAFQIVTRCSIVGNADNSVYIRAAKGTTTTPLAAGEITALQSYIDTIAFSPINYIVQSSISDKLFLEGTVYFKGQFSADIETTVEAAINAYMAGISTTSTELNGDFKVTGLLSAIRAVEGVNDVVFTDVAARADGTAFANKTFLINTSTQLLSNWQTRAGYIIEETTGGETFTDKITYTAQ